LSVSSGADQPTIKSEGNRAKALAALAPHLASYPTLDDQFAPTLRVLAQRRHPALRNDLWALRPWLAALAKRRSLLALCADLATAITETGRCWP